MAATLNSASYDQIWYSSQTTREAEMFSCEWGRDGPAHSVLAPLLSPFQMCGLRSKFCFPYAAREPNETQSLHYAFFAQHLLATVPGLNFKAFSSAVKVLFICSFS